MRKARLHTLLNEGLIEEVKFGRTHFTGSGMPAQATTPSQPRKSPGAGLRACRDAQRSREPSNKSSIYNPNTYQFLFLWICRCISDFALTMTFRY
jgi:hypothetical protein